MDSVELRRTSCAKTVARDMIGEHEYREDRLALMGGRSEWSIAGDAAKAVA